MKKTLLLIVIICSITSAQFKPFDWFNDDFHPKNDVTSATMWAWYEFDDPSTITKDANNKVTVFGDKSGNNHPLNQADTSKSPTWTSTGILFDGTSDYMKTAADTNLKQPETIYLVVKQVTWADQDRILEGNADVTMTWIQRDVSPKLRAYALNPLDNLTSTVGVYQLHRIVFNTTSSVSQINNLTPATGNVGTNNGGGLTMGAHATGGSLWSNIEVKALIIYRGTVVSDTDNALIKSYLSSKYGLGL